MADIDSARDKISTYRNVMKMNCWLLVLAMLAGNSFAQQLSNVPPAALLSVPPALPAPADANITPPPGEVKKAAPAQPTAKKKKRAKKPAALVAAPKAKAAAKAPSATFTRSEPLVPGPATVVASNVNVRGQARLNSEVLIRLTKGDSVMVLEEIVLTNSGPDEPSAWAKIALPAGRPVWISALFVDTNNSTASARLNLRGGPGENYSILGRLERGASFKPLDQKESWIKIEAPGSAYAFVAAQYLRSESSGTTSGIAAVTPSIEPVPAPVPAEPVTMPAIVADAPVIAGAPADKPVVTPPTAPPAIEAPAMTENVTAPATPVADEPPPQRIVQREGLVRGTASIQAPSYFSLVSTDTKRLIEYLISPSPDLDLHRFKGMHVIVSGEEGLEERWGNTPVLTIDRIEVVE